MYANHTPFWKYQPHEHVALEHLLLGDLRELLDEQPDEDATQWLLAVLDTLLDLLPEVFSQEEEGRYLSEVIDEYPTWDVQVFRLRRQHSALYARLRQLRDQIRRNGPSVAVSDQAAGKLRDWMAHLESHDHQECDLLQTALNLDIGGEG